MFIYFRDESVRRAEEMFHQLDNDGNGDLTEVGYYMGQKEKNVLYLSLIHI